MDGLVSDGVTAPRASTDANASDLDAKTPYMSVDGSGEPVGRVYAVAFRQFKGSPERAEKLGGPRPPNARCPTCHALRCGGRGSRRTVIGSGQSVRTDVFAGQTGRDGGGPGSLTPIAATCKGYVEGGRTQWTTRSPRWWSGPVATRRYTARRWRPTGAYRDHPVDPLLSGHPNGRSAPRRPVCCRCIRTGVGRSTRGRCPAVGGHRGRAAAGPFVPTPPPRARVSRRCPVLVRPCSWVGRA